MNDIDTERARAAAADLLDLLRAYETQLVALEQETPGLVRLRQAVGVALAAASQWVSERDVEPRRARPTTH